MTRLASLTAEPAPIEQDEDGTLRVGGTRVRLDSIVEAFKNGSAAEEILLKFPSCRLTDIYAVITYYLWRRDSIEAYLAERRVLEARVRTENEQKFPPDGIRERLLARRSPSA